MTYRELWDNNGLVGFLVAAAFKVAGFRFPTPCFVPLTTSLAVLGWEALPERARRQLRAVVDALEPRRFSLVMVYTEDWRGAGLDAFNVALLDETRTTMVVAMYTCLHFPNGRRLGEHVDCTFRSRLADGRELVTVSSRYSVRGPPEYATLRLPELPPAQVAKRHAERMSELRTEGQPYRNAEPFVSVARSELEAWIVALSHREAEFQNERGVYVPVTAEELAQLDNPAPPKPKRVRPATVLAVWCVLIVVALALANL